MNDATRLCDSALENWKYARSSTNFDFHARRSTANPLIHREIRGLTGGDETNINGPSLIRAPAWMKNPPGQYLLYFAHHRGTYIRLAYADQLEGPWKIHLGGVLHLERTPAYSAGATHIASPDVHIDGENKRILLYYHGNPSAGPQKTYLALSSDGLSFKSQADELGLFYFRVFRHGEYVYAFAKKGNVGGVLYRSCDGISGWEEGPLVLPRMRHCALWNHQGKVYIFFSRGNDCPERILVSRIENPEKDWLNWSYTEPETVLMPEMDYEGGNLPAEPSDFGPVQGFVHQLRDPALFEEDDRLYLLYAAAGESSICLAELFFSEIQSSLAARRS